MNIYRRRQWCGKSPVGRTLDTKEACSLLVDKTLHYSGIEELRHMVLIPTVVENGVFCCQTGSRESCRSGYDSMTKGANQ